MHRDEHADADGAPARRRRKRQRDAAGEQQHQHEQRRAEGARGDRRGDANAMIEGDAGGDVVAAERGCDGEQYRDTQPARKRFAVQR